MAVPPKHITLILARDLASHVGVPLFLVDPEATLVFYNEPAELLLGRRFAEAGELSVDQWGSQWTPLDPDSRQPLPVEELPLAIAVAQRRPAQREMTITAFDGAERTIDVVAFPLVADTAEFVGALALFWERAR